jgi:hypothetical protein
MIMYQVLLFLILRVISYDSVPSCGIWGYYNGG